MQNKGALWIFTAMLALACLYELSFTWVTANVENEAKEVAESKLDSLLQENSELPTSDREAARDRFESEFLLAKNTEKVYPVIGYTYKECKQRELSKGLDLQGGMNVTLEISVVDLIKVMASNSENETFNKALNNAIEQQKNAQDDFTTLFGNEINKLDPSFKLSSIFHNRENKELFPKEASNDEVLAIIRKEASDAVKRAEQVLRKRIDGLGVVQPNIQRLATSDRIVIELPGVKDKSRVRKLIQGTAKLEFWETYDNREVFTYFDQANTYMRKLKEADSDKSEDKTEGSTEGLDDVFNEEEKTEEVAAVTPDSTVIDSTLVVEGDSTSGDLLSDLAGDEEDSTSEGLGDDASFEDFAKENPLYAVIQPNFYQTAEGQAYPAEGPVVGYVSEKSMLEAKEILSDPNILKIFPKDIKLLWGSKTIVGQDGAPTDIYALYAIQVKSRDGKSKLEGDVISDARVMADPNGSPYISMSMNSTGAKVWKQMTNEAANSSINGQPFKRSVAVVLDDLVYSAPTVQGEIAGGVSSIEGRFSPQEAEDLANVLKSGKLPVRANIIEEAIVGPSLGQEAIESGMMSFAIAFALILIYMIFYYARAGVVADLALIGNIFFVFGVLTAINATLTLPGIAGIVLTIGMSVDANVLIYERIREELRAGKGMKLAIHDGYKHAYSSIIDANITTLLTGIILLVFGSGPIKGFASTLIIGICTSLFSAIFITRLIFEWMMKDKDSISFGTRITENLFNDISIKFVNKRRMYYIISGIIVGAGMMSLVVKGLNFGVDFVGGRSYLVRFENTADLNQVRTVLGDVFIDKDGIKQAPEVKTYGTNNQVKITTKYLIDEKGPEIEDKVEETLQTGLNTIGDKYEIMSSQLVEPTIADDIKTDAIWAVLFSLVVIFLYILIRFRKFQFGIGALVAMFHDVLVVLGIFSIFYGIAPWSMEIDQAFIAAILTVVGYSINDTVVVFDRIREYVGLHKSRPYKQVVNEALNSTLSRTINTSMSTFLVLLMIFMFGGEVIRGFVFALMVGVIVGTYSSLCVATPTVIDLSKEEDDKK
jgi:SecD/SecF fusion protein